MKQCEWSLPLLEWFKEHDIPMQEMVFIDHEKRVVSFLLSVRVHISEEGKLNGFEAKS